jgi:hypothetical protein
VRGRPPRLDSERFEDLFCFPQVLYLPRDCQVTKDLLDADYYMKAVGQGA